MVEVEEVHGGRVPAVHQADLQAAEEPRQVHPEVVADQKQGLDPLAVALPQGVLQLATAAGPLPEQPLLELVQHDQHLLRARRAPLLPELPQEPRQVLMAGELREPAVQVAEQARLGPLHRSTRHRRTSPNQPTEGSTRRGRARTCRCPSARK